MLHRSWGLALAALLSACAITGPKTADEAPPAFVCAVYPAADPYLGEALQPGEIAEAGRLIRTLSDEIRQEYPPGVARRDAHTKAHGCVRARFSVNEDIPADLVHGVFQPGASYPALLRYSNGTPGAPRPDITGDMRGMAIKLFDVPGPRLFETPGREKEHDFILISKPYFFINGTRHYAELFQALDSDSMLSKLKIPFLLGWQGSINAWRMLHQTIANPLETQYFSLVPYQLGLGEERIAVKYSAKPCEPGTSRIPDNPGMNYLREAMVDTLGTGEACMIFMIQRRTSPSLSVENSVIAWPEDEAPFIPVGRITVPSQNFNTPQQNAACENQSFNPWRVLPAHKPLGAINRTRRVLYEHASELRRGLNGVEDKN